jgi:hypothetical protein
MKRFFCVKCKRVVRTRRTLPLTPDSYWVNDEEDLVVQPDPRNRTGLCYRHRHEDAPKGRAA